MKVDGQTLVDTQVLIDAALEIENLKRECNEMAQKLRNIQIVVDEQESEYLDSINADSYINYPGYVSIKSVGTIVGLDMEQRKENWMIMAKKRKEFLKEMSDDTQSDC